MNPDWKPEWDQNHHLALQSSFLCMPLLFLFVYDLKSFGNVHLNLNIVLNIPNWNMQIAMFNLFSEDLSWVDTLPTQYQ